MGLSEGISGREVALLPPYLEFVTLSTNDAFLFFRLNKEVKLMIDIHSELFLIVQTLKIKIMLFLWVLRKYLFLNVHFNRIKVQRLVKFCVKVT